MLLQIPNSPQCHRRLPTRPLKLYWMPQSFFYADSFFRAKRPHTLFSIYFSATPREKGEGSCGHNAYRDIKAKEPFPPPPLWPTVLRCLWCKPVRFLIYLFPSKRMQSQVCLKAMHPTKKGGSANTTTTTFLPPMAVWPDCEASWKKAFCSTGVKGNKHILFFFHLQRKWGGRRALTLRTICYLTHDRFST